MSSSRSKLPNHDIQIEPTWLLSCATDIHSSRYLYYANETRAEQELSRENEAKVGIIGILWPSKKTQHVENTTRRNSATIGLGGEKGGDTSDSASPPAERINVSDEEWINAQRAIRQASAAACFYLITTDILGPFGLAYAFATVGWG